MQARRGSGARTLQRSEPRHRDLGLPRRGAAERVRAHARAVPGRRLPRPGQIRLQQRRRGRSDGPPALVASGCSASIRTRRATSSRPRPSVRSPRACRPARAVLAANLETAINGLWDADPRIGDRIAVIGAGAVGCLVAWLAGRIPGCEVELVDIEPAPRSRRPRARRRLRPARRRAARRGPRDPRERHARRRGARASSSPGSRRPSSS